MKRSLKLGMLIGLCATLVAPASAQGLSDIHPSVFLAGIFVLACFVGYYVVWAVTPALHTPLMSVTNAISAVVVVGAIIAAAATGIGASEASETGDIWIARSLGAGAVFLASINIFGGFLITRRMLAMYKTKS